MPRLSVWLIRAALLYLAVGFSLGALILFHKGLPLDAGLWRWLPIHIEFLLFGWTMQLALGVAYWVLPRSRGERPRAAWAVAAGILLNVGVWCVCLGVWTDVAPGLTALGRTSESLAALAFVWHAWPRVKAAGA